MPSNLPLEKHLALTKYQLDNHDANFNNNSNQNLIYAMNCKTTKIITIEDLQYIRIQIEIEIKM